MQENLSGIPVLSRPWWQRYLVAVLCVTVAALLRLLTDPFLGDQLAYEAFLLAVVVAAFYGGIGAALLATALGAVVARYWFVAPRHDYWIAGLANWLAWARFLLLAAAVAVLAEAYRRLLRREISAREKTEDELRSTISHLRLVNEVARQSEQRAVSERQQVERQLRISKERMKVAEAAAHLAIFDWDLREQSMTVGGDLQPIFGVRTERWRGYDSWKAAVYPDDRAYMEGAIARAIEERKPLDVEFRAMWPDESVHWVTARGKTSYDEAGKPLRMIGIYQDITQRKATEQALIRNEKLAAAGRLAVSIAHEINNPLAALTNLLFIVKNDSTLSRAGAQYLSLADQELSRIARLAKQALGFHRDTSEPVRTNICDVLDEVLSLYTPNMPANIRVETRYGPSVHVWALRGEISQVFANLISNAIHALESGGHLIIEATASSRSNEEGMLARIRDDGPGIAEENLPNIFEPFFTTKKETGVGLGLWIVKQIVEKHGGSVQVDSRTDPEQHGTCFSIFLPSSARYAAGTTTAA